MKKIISSVKAILQIGLAILLIYLFGHAVLSIVEITDRYPITEFVIVNSQTPISKYDFYLAFYAFVFLFFFFPMIKKWVYNEKGSNQEKSEEIRRLIAISNNGLNLTGWNIIAVDLSKLDLSTSNFTKSLIRESDFSFANLKHSIFSESNIIDSDFSWAQMDFCSFEDTHLSLKSIRNVDFTNAELRNANFRNCNLVKVNFSYAILENVDFTGAELSNVLFTGANLSGAIGLSEDYKI